VFSSGQFVATNPTSAAPGPFELPPQSIVADLNQDGLQDLILYSTNTVQIYYAADNLGGFGFAGSRFAFTGVEFTLDNDFCSAVVSVTTGDFNGDGYPDIAMLCNDPAGTADNVLVYLNQKDGTFGKEAAIFPAPSAHLIAAADFNKDGNTDILLIGPDGNTDPNGGALTGFNLYAGDGAGDFSNSTPVDVPFADGVQVAAVDFNNDGFPDIALLYHDFFTGQTASQIEVFQNDGKGNFPLTPTYQQSLGDVGATFQFFTPTLPGSKYPNIVAVNNGDDASIAVVFNNQTPAIGFSDTIYTTPVPGLLTATMGDFNGDGLQDVATYDGTNLSVYNAGKTGQYDQPIDSLTLSTSLSLLVGSSDANGDGYSDPIAFITPSDGPRLVQQFITSGTATATLPNLTFASGSHSLTATTPGTPTLAPGTATATLVSNGPTQTPVSNAVLTTSPASPTTYAPSNPVTLIAEVDSVTSPAPTGQISFFNAQTGALLGTANLTATSTTTSSASLSIGTLTAGSYTFSATYPGDTSYLPATLSSATLVVNQATPVIGFVPNPATITYGTALSGAQLDATATLGGTTVAGSFVYTNASGTVVDTTTVLPGGSNSITATFTPADTTNYKAPAPVTSVITVNKATPTVAFVPNPATLASAAPLTAAQLDATATFGGSAVPGSFIYTNASGATVNIGTVLPAGANVITASFTPSNTTNFNVPAGVPATITVNAATTTLTFVPNPATITYGTAISSAQLDATATSGGSSVAGTFVYTNASGTVVNTTTILPAGPNAITVNFTPTDTTSFTTPAAVTSTITVNKATPTVSWTQPAAISYGTALSGTQLNATASFNSNPVAGTFTYNPVAGTVLTAGTHTLSVTFTPTDATDFNVATGSVNIAVSQATPAITWAPPAAITLGTALDATQLNASATGVGGAALAGTFSYSPAAGTVPPVGANTLGVTFTPTDATDYKTATASVALTVNPAVTTTTVTSSANPGPFGQTVTFTVGVTSSYTGAAITGSVNVLDGQTLLGTVQLPTLTFSTSTLSTGTHNITAVYSGSTNFASSTSTVLTETISSATTTITWPTPAGITYGTLLSATQLNATAIANAATVPGTFVYTPAAGTLLTAGTQTLSVAFTPTDTVNFKSATGSVTITVAKAAPTITWPNPADVIAGSALSATQLNATATGVSGALPGTFAYTPASGTVLTAGAHTLSVTFTPTDLTDYTTATASVPLNVIGLALTSLSTGSVKLGDPALNLTVTGTGFLPNSVVSVGATALTTTFVSSTTLTVTIPASNFLTVQTLQITVTDPTQALTSNALAIVVGAPTATITVNGPPTVVPAAQPNLTFTVTPYAVPITATLTLTFTPAPGLTTDGTILFANGTTTTTFTIPANTTTIPPVPFQSGSVAGTITIALKLTAGGVDVTPTPAPTLVITSPPAAPGIAGVTLDRSSDTLTVTIQGYSNTRDIKQVHFHFVAASGQSLATSDLVIDGSALFGTWYANPASPTYGSTFHYIQVFNLDQAATVVGQVQVTLVNSQGNSQTVSAQ